MSGTLPRVLIVDDNAMNIELVTYAIGTQSCTVESARDAHEAVRRIDLFRPDIILMDIQMPGMDGLELTRQIKADPLRRHIVILAFTAYSMRGDEIRMRAAGCDGCISKPIDVATFGKDVLSYVKAKP